jgi:hypothetical protein
MFLTKILGGQNGDYHIFHKILIFIIIVMALYHISKLEIHETDTVIFFYIVMLEMIGIIFEIFA